jgi:anti-sigma B factor antagonist
MQAEYQETGGVLKVLLDGRLDTDGVHQAELGFSARVASSPLPVIVDLARVSFLASLGVRMFISTGRVRAAKGGKMILFAPTDEVRDIIETMGLDEIIPVTGDEAAALAQALA